MPAGSLESGRVGVADLLPPAARASSTRSLPASGRATTLDDGASEVEGSSLSQDSPIEVIMAMSDLYKPNPARARKSGTPARFNGATPTIASGSRRCDDWHSMAGRCVNKEHPPLAATTADTDKGAGKRGARPFRAHPFEHVHPLLRLPRQSSDMADPWLMDGDGALDGPSGDPRALCLGEDPFLQPPPPRCVSASARAVARSVDGTSCSRPAASPRVSMDAAALHHAGKAYASRTSFGDMSSQQPATLRLSEHESQSSLDLPTVNHLSDGQQALHNVGHLESVRELDAPGGEQSYDGRALLAARYLHGYHRDPWRSVDSLLDTAAAEQRRRRRLQLFESGVALTLQLVRPSARLPQQSNNRRSCQLDRGDPCTPPPARVGSRLGRSAVGDWIAGGSPYTRLSASQRAPDLGCEAWPTASGRAPPCAPLQRLSAPSAAAAPAASQSPFSVYPGTDDEAWGHGAARRRPVPSAGGNVLSSRGSSRSAKEALLQRLARVRLSTSDASRHVVESASCPALGDTQQPALECDHSSGVRELRSSLLERIHHVCDQRAREI